jgi:hypothetical protein
LMHGSGWISNSMLMHGSGWISNSRLVHESGRYVDIVFKFTTQHKGISITLTTHPINHTNIIKKMQGIPLQEVQQNTLRI